MPDALLYATAAPVLKVDGQRRGELGRDLLRLEVEEDVKGLRTLVAHFVGSAHRGRPADTTEYLDGAVLDFGRELSASMGPPGNEKIVFTGTVSALEATFDEGDVPHVSVFAEDALMKLRMMYRSRTYTDVSDGDVARKIATEYGLAADVNAPGPTYKVIEQMAESDLSLLRQRAALVAAEVWVEGTTLHFAARTHRRGADVTLVQGSNLLNAALRADLAYQCTGVDVTGFDAQRRERIDGKAAPSVVQAEVVDGGRTGAATLHRALGDLPVRRADRVPLGVAEARAWAEAEMLRRGRRFVTVSGTTSGTPELVVGSRVTLRSVGKPFEGPGYYVTRFRHTFDLSSGMRTYFEAERPSLNASAA